MEVGGCPTKSAPGSRTTLLHSLVCPALQPQYVGPELVFSPQIYLGSSGEMSRLEPGELEYLQAGTGGPYEPEAGYTGRKLLALPPPALE